MRYLPLLTIVYSTTRPQKEFTSAIQRETKVACVRTASGRVSKDRTIIFSAAVLLVKDNMERRTDGRYMTESSQPFQRVLKKAVRTNQSIETTYRRLRERNTVCTSHLFRSPLAYPSAAAACEFFLKHRHVSFLHALSSPPPSRIPVECTISKKPNDLNSSRLSLPSSIPYCTTNSPSRKHAAAALGELARLQEGREPTPASNPAQS